MGAVLNIQVSSGPWARRWTWDEVGGSQNYGPFLGTLNIRGRIIIGTQKGTIILTFSQVNLRLLVRGLCCRASVLLP